MAKVIGTVEGEWEALKGESYYPDTMLRQASLYKKLEETSNSLPEGEVVGALISFPVADGCAIYRVEKASPLSLAHVPRGDAWQASPVLIRGLKLSDVKQMINRSKKVKKMFG